MPPTSPSVMSAAAGNAAQTVFGTNELLEIVLTFVSLESLPKLQVVSRRWKYTIERLLVSWTRPDCRPISCIDVGLVVEAYH